MSSSFFTALSGIEAASQDLSVISNNLANLDTTGFKDSEASFQDLFYQIVGTDGAGNPTEIGAGTTISAVVAGFTQGTINSTGVPTDMAIQGNGFFMEDNNGTTLYTRDGTFSQDAEGNLVTSDGGSVLGYPAVNGVISPSQTLAPLQIPSGQTFPPKATTNVEMSMNLDASGSALTTASGTLTLTGMPNAGETVTAGGTTYTFVTALTTNPSTVPDQILISTAASGAEAATLSALAAAINGSSGSGTTYSAGTQPNGSVTAIAGASTLSLADVSPGSAGNSVATTTNMAKGTFGAATLTGGADAATFSQPIVVYDSLGTSHTLTFNFSKTAANTWSYKITIPAADEGGSGSPAVLTAGTLQFNSSGNLTSPAANVTGVNIANLADGAKTLNLTWQLFDPTTGRGDISQVAGDSNISGTQQDGYSSGALQTFSVKSDGTIQGVFSNGQTLTLGQIAMANFSNTQGLQANGSDTYVATPSAGNPSVGAPDSGGRGTVVGGALESSNVNMVAELSNLITAERNYQANARTISTEDQMVNYVLTMQP